MRRFCIFAAVVLVFALGLGCRPEDPLAPVGNATGDGSQPVSTAPALGEHARGVPKRLLREARGALSAVITAEQVAFQRDVQFFSAANTEELLSRSLLDLSSVVERWDFSVHDVTATGFVATARGRPRTPARGIEVSVMYVRLAEPVWTVRGPRRPRGER